MGLQAKNGYVGIRNGIMDFIRFGTGPRNLVMLPGLGDGLQTVRGTAIPMAWMYRIFAKDCTVWCFSRKRSLPEGYTTRDMARDLKEAMDSLGIARADLLGVSMGGMIAQWFAVDYPEAVGRLILTVTSSRPNPLLIRSVEEWMDMARKGDHTALMDSNVRKIYSDGYYRKNRWLIPLMGRFTKPRSYDRFLIQARACLTHNAHPFLDAITAPTLVIGGRKDQCLGGEASEAIAEKIPGAKLCMYDEWGHGLYEEAEDFNQRVLEFLK